MIRTTNELVQKIAEDLVWRRKELTELRALVESHRSGIRGNVVVRGAVALLYAHWEGFVKKVGTYYVQFVAAQRLSNRELAPNFVGLVLRAKLKEMSASDKAAKGNQLAEFMCNGMDVRARLPTKDVVDTKSNLSSTVLVDILEALGLDPDQFATRFRFIDSQLVNPRNHIAHGEALFLTSEEYLELHDDVLALVETFRNEVENASVLKRFRRHADARVPISGAGVQVA